MTHTTRKKAEAPVHAPRLQRRCQLLHGSVLGSLVMLAGAGLHAQGGSPPRPLLQALDSDHDGSLSPAELQAAPQAILALDRNGDGQLTPDEWQPRPENSGASPDQLVQQLMQFDRNGDGSLTAEELPARMQPLLARGDANHDGRLTPDEIRAMAAHQGMPAGIASAHANPARRNDPLVTALDRDNDGTLSATEIAAAPHSLRTLDKNGDGQISPDEMQLRQPSPEERVRHLLEEWDTNRDGKLSPSEAPDRLQQQFVSIDTNQDGFLDSEELLAYFHASAGQNAGPHRAGLGEHNNATQEHQQ